MSGTPSIAHVLVLAGLAVATAPAAARNADIVKTITVEGSLAETWAAWTTDAGARSFFAPDARIEPTPGGAYEILFYPDRAAGQRGAENTRIMAIEPMERLVFSWNAPPAWPDIRRQFTAVEIRFVALSERRTEVRLIHGLWGDSPDWLAVNRYFDEAWDVVLYRLQHRFSNGPVDWRRPPRPQIASAR